MLMWWCCATSRQAYMNPMGSPSFPNSEGRWVSCSCGCRFNPRTWQTLTQTASAVTSPPPDAPAPPFLPFRRAALRRQPRRLPSPSSTRVTAPASTHRRCMLIRAGAWASVAGLKREMGGWGGAGQAAVRLLPAHQTPPLAWPVWHPSRPLACSVTTPTRCPTVSTSHALLRTGAPGCVHHPA